MAKIMVAIAILGFHFGSGVVVHSHTVNLRGSQWKYTKYINPIVKRDWCELSAKNMRIYNQVAVLSLGHTKNIDGGKIIVDGMTVIPYVELYDEIIDGGYGVYFDDMNLPLQNKIVIPLRLLKDAKYISITFPPYDKETRYDVGGYGAAVNLANADGCNLGLNEKR